VATRERPSDRGSRRAAQTRSEIGEELRRARVQTGLSQSFVAGAAGLARSTIGRIERAELPGVSLDVLCRVGAVLGLNLVLRAYPSGDAVRDAGHVALLQRLRRRLPPGIAWATEVPLPLRGDLRAWDAVIGSPGQQVAVEAETRIADLQAVERRVGLKQRDGVMPRVVILVSDTAANRRALAIGRAALRPAYPLDTREVMAALLDGRQPPANGIAIL
jgi:transcriptional regulator with XRE-family HTH domain